MQRNLSAEGIAQAQRIGAALRDHGLDGGPVYASPFCRGVDTALAMLGLPTGPDADPAVVQREESLRNLTSAGHEQVRQQILEDSTSLIASHVGGPDLVIMVGHGMNIEALTQELIGEGDAVVLGPGDPFAVRAVITADAW